MSATPDRLRELPPDDRLRLEAWLAEFEEAWDEGRLAVQVERLPPPGQPLRLAALIEMVKIDLERQWQRGRCPRAADYLARYPELATAGALPPDLLLAEEEAGRQFGDAPTTRPAAPPAGPAGAGEAPRVPGHDVLGVLGRGGMGLVVRGRDRHLGRDVAVKLLRAEYRGQSHLVRRFLKEARIHGRLQHPGIVPVYQLGEFPSGPPYFTMKLVQGRTLADLLDQREDPDRDLPRFLTVFEQVCQTVAYAHSKGVIHRDLKPGNVMVGAFGEVQVMDWGLAKVLNGEGGSPAGPAPEGDPEIDGDPAAADRTLPTRSGEAVGTLPYMPPEQARGEVERMDQRCDVFGLGAMLCEILTGEPPFPGRDTTELLARARACDHAEALARLDRCGAGAELVRLARACLAAEPADRPRDAAVVAAAVTAYQAGVQQRLRDAEVERAAAQARAQEAKATAAAERKSRRRTAWLAVAVLLLVVGGGGAAWWAQQQSQARAAEAAQLRADATAERAVGEARLLLNKAKDDPLGNAGLIVEALAAAHKAEDVAQTVEASEGMRQQAAALVEAVNAEKAAAAQNRDLVRALLEVRGPREGPGHRTDLKESQPAPAELSADEQFKKPFRKWDPTFDVDVLRTAEAAARLKRLPAAVLTEVVAALDEWAGERRRRGRPAAECQRLEELAAALDDAPDPRRRELRDLLTHRHLGRERAGVTLLVALGGRPVPFDPGLVDVRNRLGGLAEEMDVSREPILGLLTLARAQREGGDDSGAERLLRRAVLARPQQAVLYDTLGKLLEEQQPPRWPEAVECYVTARWLRPELGEALARALVKSGRAGEGLALYDLLLRQRKDDPWLHFRRGDALRALRRYPEAEEAYGKALGLQGKFPEALNNLGIALFEQGHHDRAKERYDEAIRQRREYPEAHFNLGKVLLAQHDYDEAAKAFRLAIDDKSDYPEAYLNLGEALRRRGDVPGAAVAYRRAIDLRPDWSGAHNNLGIALFQQRRYEEAKAEFRAALRWNPQYPGAHANTGNALRMQKRYPEAEEEYRTALAIQPDHALSLCNLGLTLRDQGRFAAALEYLEKGGERGRKVPGWDPQWVPQCRELVALDRLLPAVLGGVARPASPEEGWKLASLCWQYKGLYGAAARLYEAAFDADPPLAENLWVEHRYHAARSAALAAAQGEGRGKLPDEVLGMRRRALRWLGAQLALYEKLVKRQGDVARGEVRRRLTGWLQDPDLASVRDEEALGRMPDKEREEWRKLWERVNALRSEWERPARQ